MQWIINSIRSSKSLSHCNLIRILYIITRSFTLWELDLFVKNYTIYLCLLFIYFSCNFTLSRIPFEFNWCAIDFKEPRLYTGFGFGFSLRLIWPQVWHCGNRKRSRRDASFEWFEATAQFAFIVADLIVSIFFIYVHNTYVYLIFSLSLTAFTEHFSGVHCFLTYAIQFVFLAVSKC